MKKYALCYIHSTNSQNLTVVIEKLRPEWQKGRYNLLGGHVEDGETFEEAALREVIEESDIGRYRSRENEPKLLGYIKGDGWIVGVCYLYTAIYGVQGQTDEPVYGVYIKDILKDPKLMDNLKVIIPLCRFKVSGWTLTQITDTQWVLDLDAPEFKESQ